jgi:hypothetical protein
MLLDYPIHSISISGVRVALGHGMGRRRLPWPLGGLIVPGHHGRVARLKTTDEAQRVIQSNDRMRSGILHMKWVKGVSGNPGGRPKLELSIRELAQQHSMEALETLVHVMRTGRRGEQIVAANAILDRAYGRPSQSIEMSSDRTTLVDLLVSLNNSHAVNDPATRSPSITDAVDTGDSDADLLSVPDRHH